ncbi:hypothetical protein GQ55_5G500600 [Panicum hallii var. hallii]|uniref:Secreted protein n=1 Tax=Panicum hallii var. hallii TaxID=1504633 RepID=A0A2T7DRX8_9POAL|nr:hypothetical protein GQ55_5G500600 [Panicum hallii var. hallii]
MGWFASVHLSLSLSLSFCRPALGLPVAWRCRAKAAQGRQADWPDARARGGGVAPQLLAGAYVWARGHSQAIRGGNVVCRRKTTARCEARPARMRVLLAGLEGENNPVRGPARRLRVVTRRARRATAIRSQQGPPPSLVTQLPSCRRDGNWGGCGNASCARGDPGTIWAASSDRRSPGCEATELAEVAGGGAGSPATPAPP